MKKLLFCFIILLIILTGCPTRSGDQYILFVSRDASPFMLDIVVENKTSEDIEIFINRWADMVNHAQSITTLSFCSTFTYEKFTYEKNSFKIEKGKENEIKNYALIDNSALKVFSRAFFPGFHYSENDYTTIFPGCFYLSLFEKGKWQYCYIDPYREASEKFSLYKKDVFDLTVEDFEAVGGDLYYVFDPKEKTSFGHVVSSVDELNGMESGHVKIKYTIKDDPDNEGKRLVEFSYLGEVTDSE